MAPADKRNEQFMKLVRSVHSLVVTDDLDKNRQSQNSIGKILGTRSKEAVYSNFMIGDIPAEIVKVNRPYSKKQIILYCHGGGYISGSLHYARILTTKLAAATSMEVLSFDYRLAPEHTFPAALHDALEVWNYLMQKGYGSTDVIVVGDSAGGNLALSLGLKLKEEQRFLPGGFACLSPWTDLTISGKSHKRKADLDPILDFAYMNKARYSYIGEETFNNPLISPLFGDFTDFPPVYTQVGSNEILLSDSEDLHRRLLKQGVLSKLDIYKGMWHVFQMSNFKIANEAVDKIAEFIFTLTR